MLGLARGQVKLVRDTTSKVIIGIDASRANKNLRTGTEWYSYFLIEELKKVTNLSFLPRIEVRGKLQQESEPESKMFSSEVQILNQVQDDKDGKLLPDGRGEGDIKFFLYSKEPLIDGLENLPKNFEAKVLRWPLKFFWTQIRLSWEMIFHPPDALFVPAHALPMFSRAKMVVTIHDIGFKVFPHLYSWKDILYHRFSTWFASHFAVQIICPSEFTKTELMKYYSVDSNKVAVIHHGVHRPHNELPPPRPSATPPRAGGEYIFFIGRLEEKKNVLKIVQAFEKVLLTMPELRLILAGRPGYGFETVKNYIASRSLGSKISFLGYVAEDRKDWLYKNALALIFPTLYEGFGLPILEAQKIGCPVITSNFGANKEIAGDGALLVDPYDAANIAEAVAKIAVSDGTRNALIEKGYKNAEKYSWPKAAEQTFSILSSTKIESN